MRRTGAHQAGQLPLETDDASKAVVESSSLLLLDDQSPGVTIRGSARDLLPTLRQSMRVYPIPG
jgi:hypothetical protein